MSPRERDELGEQVLARGGEKMGEDRYYDRLIAMYGEAVQP